MDIDSFVLLNLWISLYTVYIFLKMNKLCTEIRNNKPGYSKKVQPHDCII